MKYNNRVHGQKLRLDKFFRRLSRSSRFIVIRSKLKCELFGGGKRTGGWHDTTRHVVACRVKTS